MLEDNFRYSPASIKVGGSQIRPAIIPKQTDKLDIDKIQDTRVALSGGKADLDQYPDIKELLEKLQHGRS
jgi:hypothetical protein